MIRHGLPAACNQATGPLGVIPIMQTIEAVPESDRNQYVLAQYRTRIDYYWRASRNNKKGYTWSRYLIIVLGSLVTLLTSLSASQVIAGWGLENFLSILAPFLAALVSRFRPRTRAPPPGFERPTLGWLGDPARQRVRSGRAARPGSSGSPGTAGHVAPVCDRATTSAKRAATRRPTPTLGTPAPLQRSAVRRARSLRDRGLRWGGRRDRECRGRQNWVGFACLR